MELSTKNIDKAIRTVKRMNEGLHVTIHRTCNKCGKKVRKNYLGIVNGFGGLNYYHIRCVEN